MTTFLIWLGAILLLGWIWSGWRKLPVGSRGLVLKLGERTEKEVEEGWQWTLCPFYTIEPVDCREKILNLGEAEFTTKDNTKVKVSSTITYKVNNMNKYLGVERQHIENALDEKRTEVLRSEIRLRDLKEVLSLGPELGLKVKESIEHEDWGVDIKHVVIPTIIPDPKVAEDLALKAREELQRNGQRVEMENFRELYADLQKSPDPNIRGLSPEQAYEAMLYLTGKADPKKIYGIDPAVVAAIMSFTRRP
jgi:regulator of protease activity HflC (stomatin/prohibitin superfamily)